MPASLVPSPHAPPTPLDPFGFWPDRASGIAGLGGAAAADPGQAFHSPYVLVHVGEACFQGRFDGLVATGGTLTLRVLERRFDGERSRTIARSRLPLADLARTGGDWRIGFRARRDAIYAVLADLSPDNDATAAALHLALQGWSDGTWHRERMARARTRVFGPSPTGWRAALSVWATRRAGLLADDPATLAAPLSQMCTAAQMTEPAFLRILDAFQSTPTRHRKQWEVAYIVAVLEEAGMLRPDARGLGFGCGREAFPSFFAARGCRIVATDQAPDEAAAAGWIATGQHSRHPAGLHWPALCDAEPFAERVRFREVDMNAIPADLKGFDFCWSACSLEHLGSLRAGERFIERSVDCLRPGGVAVHTTELNLCSNTDTITRGPTVLYRRRDLEGLARRLRRAGHRVLPLRFDPGHEALDEHLDVPPYTSDPHLRLMLSRYAATSFGIAVVRGG
jgi:SAM-dependent methyltransferase